MPVNSPGLPAASLWLAPILRRYLGLRSLAFTLEGLILPLASYFATKKKPAMPWEDPELFWSSRKALAKLLEQDAAAFANGIFPLPLLKPENPAAHVSRLQEIVLDTMAAARRRQAKKTKIFSPKAARLASKVPEYYRRNFHFQNDGYLSAESARLYDHQVEILFAGAGDAMRRYALVPLLEEIAELESPRILELACGSGSATRFLAAARPDAEIVAVDLSPPYIDQAKNNALSNVEFMVANAAKLDRHKHLKNTAGSFAAVFSIFLFHELPLPEREAVIAQAYRALRPGGILVLADSLQLGDRREFDAALERFPANFHEPFYGNYIRHPLKQLVSRGGFRQIRERQEFFLKVVVAQKPRMRAK